MVTCKVCDSFVPPRKTYKRYICEACQKFFRRYCSRRFDVVCSTGQNNCYVNESSRRRCVRCRLEKAISIGMRSRFMARCQQQGDNNCNLKQQAFDEAHLLENSSNNNSESFDDGESGIVAHQAGASSSSNTLSSSPPTTAPKASCYTMTLDSTNDLLLLNCREQTPCSAFTVLPPLNRNNEFVASEPRNFYESAINSSFPNFFYGAKPDFANRPDLNTSSPMDSVQQLFRICSSFTRAKQNVAEPIENSQFEQDFSDWNPSFVVCILLCGLMVYNENASVDLQIGQVRQQLLLALDLALLRLAGGDAEALRQMKDNCRRCLQAVDPSTVRGCYSLLTEAAKRLPMLSSAVSIIGPYFY